MAKRKKRNTTKRPPNYPVRQAVAAVGEAMELFEDGKHGEAKVRLERLAERYPRSKPVLMALLHVCHNLEDWPSLARYSEQLLPLEQGLERAETLNSLVVTYTQLMYPALAWQTAQELISQHPDFADADMIKAFAQSTDALLREGSEEWLVGPDLTPEELRHIQVQHDRIRFYTASGQPEKAIASAESVLEKAPNVIPILNNLSLSQFVVGNANQAIATAEKVLAQAPHNFNALGNLTRYCFLTAQFGAAQDYAARLKQLRDGSPDLETKQAEALAFLGDDEGVREAYQRAKKQYDELSPLLLHLAAAAHYRLGDEKTAWRLWRQAVKQQPSFALAQNNLADQQRPAGERDAPWYWSMPYWFSADFRHTFDKTVRTKSSKAFTHAIQDLLDKYPYVSQLFPHMLERGDRTARQFAINLTRLVNCRDLLRVLYDFALGRYGADDLRMEAIQLVSQGYPELLPENGQVAMWLQGRQIEIFLLGFEVYQEPEPPEDVADEILDKDEEAYDLLMSGEAKAAERLLKEVIAAAPDFPSAYNHLAVAYERQGRKKEARVLVEETHARFPDYAFARISLARFHALDKQIEKAKDLVDPVMRRKRLHISEFRALAQTQMEIALADENKDAARQWLDMWAQMEADHPEMMRWRLRIEDRDALLKSLQKLAGRSKRRTRR